ncbi:MAG: peptidylprolyl isomerase [Candidatus Brocadia sp.]|nr:peptidylprolyl isomerase [Candidatus Brocadia sp.]
MSKRFIFLACLILMIFQPDTFSAEKGYPGDVIATVNGKSITQEMLYSRLRSFTDTDPETLNTIRQEIIDQLITDILLDEFIDKQGLIVTPQEIEREVGLIRRTITGNQGNINQSLEQILASIGSTIDEFKRSVKYSIALEKYFHDKFDDKALKKYFEENKGVFSGESVKVSHILIDTRNMKTQDELLHALEQIKNIKREIDRGAAFDEVAKKYSNSSSAQNGGDLGFIQRKGNFAKSFLDTAFSLRVGQVSEPIQTEYGYHLVKVTDRKEGADIQFEDVKEKVRLEVLDAEILKLLERLRKEAKIVINR